MKKLFLLVSLFLAVSSVSAQTFVPTVGVKYNIKHVSSGFVIGLQTGDDVTSRIVTSDNSSSQAWVFIPVSGKTNIYNIKNSLSKYLNNINGDKWQVMTEAALNGVKSEWLLTGTVATSIRLQNLNPTSGYPNTAYLGSQGTYENLQLICDNTLNSEGVFSLVAVSSSTGDNSLSSAIKAIVVDHNLTVMGVDSYAVYNVQGMKVADVKVNNATTHVALESGIYIVKSFKNVQKVSIK